MNSLKVVVIVVAVFPWLVFANNNQYDKCPDNTPHLTPCTKSDGYPGVCRSNGDCVNIQCTKFCQDPLPTPAPSTTPGPTTTPAPIPDCTTVDIDVNADFPIATGNPTFTAGGTNLSPGSSDTIDCGSGTLQVTYTCAADGSGLFLDSIDCVSK